jgi:SAM-dependent methyltransferase
MRKRLSVESLLKLHKGEILKLDIGCGDNKMDDHIGMDNVDCPCVDVLHDMTNFPWPFPKETFTLLSSHHVLEHIPRENGVFIQVMNECWRILKFDGQFRIAVPYGGSTMYFADPTHINPIVPQTFHYFDPLAPMQTYHVYKPKPWAIQQLFWAPDGNIECLLTKRRLDPSYGKRV